MAARYAAANPDDIDKLVLVSPAGLVSTSAAMPDFADSRGRRHRRRCSSPIPAWIEPFWPADPSPEWEAVRARESAAAFKLARGPRHGDRQGAARWASRASTARRCCCGARPTASSRSAIAEDWREVLPKAELAVIPGGSHLLLDEFPARSRRAAGSSSRPELMLDSPRPSSSDVTTTMKYVVRGEKSTFHAGDRGQAYWPGEERGCTFHDMRPEQATALALERNGFVLLGRPADRRHRVHRTGREARYAEQCEALVQLADGRGEESSASARSSAPTPPAPTATTSRRTARTSTTATARWRDFTRDLLPEDEAERRLAGPAHADQRLAPDRDGRERARWAVRRAARCKQARTCSTARSSAASATSSAARCGASTSPGGPSHRWYWVPHMQPWEVLVFKLFDSDPDAGPVHRAQRVRGPDHAARRRAEAESSRSGRSRI